MTTILLLSVMKPMLILASSRESDRWIFIGLLIILEDYRARISTWPNTVIAEPN